MVDRDQSFKKFSDPFEKVRGTLDDPRRGLRYLGLPSTSIIIDSKRFRT